jgi:hypothetical protein
MKNGVRNRFKIHSIRTLISKISLLLGYMKTCARLLPFLLLLLVLFWGLQGSHESSFMSQGAQRKLSEGPLGPIAKVADILARGGGDTRAV